MTASGVAVSQVLSVRMVVRMDGDGDNGGKLCLAKLWPGRIMGRRASCELAVNYNALTDSK